MPLRSVIGSLRLLRRRATQVGQPGLAVWIDAGERAAADLGESVRSKTHADEVADNEAAKHIAAGIAGLKDGKIDPVDLAHFAAGERLAKRSAELARQAGEAVRL